MAFIFGFFGHVDLPDGVSYLALLELRVRVSLRFPKCQGTRLNNDHRSIVEDIMATA